MNTRYNAADIEVLSGLDPVKRRPGMYTDTTRPNHLAQEVIDNSVDEALGGHAKLIEVVLHADGSVEVSDDGRGMPVDVHPEEGIPGVELILTRLHAGGKFSGKNYTFSGGLHGVGVSVVNALSKKVEVFIKRDGQEHRMEFRDGDRSSALDVVGTVGKRNTGTRLRFWPDPKYFDSPKISVRALRHLLRAKAVLCPGLTVALFDEASGERISNLSRAYRVNLTVLALVALFTGAFLVFSVLALSVARRQPPLALLGVLGLTAAQRQRLVMAEAGVLGLVGSGVGLLLGTALAWLALRLAGGDLGGGAGAPALAREAGDAREDVCSGGRAGGGGAGVGGTARARLGNRPGAGPDDVAGGRCAAGAGAAWWPTTGGLRARICFVRRDTGTRGGDGCGGARDGDPGREGYVARARHRFAARSRRD